MSLPSAFYSRHASNNETLCSWNGGKLQAEARAMVKALGKGKTYVRWEIRIVGRAGSERIQLLAHYRYYDSNRHGYLESFITEAI